MTLNLTHSAWEELWNSPPQTQPIATQQDDFETLTPLPVELGSGYSRSFNLAPGLSLGLENFEFQQDVTVRVPDHEHPIQIVVYLSGVQDSGGLHPTMGNKRAYFSGGGISPGYWNQDYAGQRLMTVNVEIEPELLELTFGDLPSSIKSLLNKGRDWKDSFYPTVTPALRSLSQQIWNAPYRGATQRMYLYSKAWELLAMQIDLLETDQGSSVVVAKLRPDTVAKLHYAKEILAKSLEHPPLLPDLARQVGVSDRTLLRGFRRLFGITPMGYVTQQRMQLARRLLLEGNWTVAEAARMAGYGHLGHFATAFRRQFGMNPREYLKRSS
jgi:AraC-like DNA-binding protein